MKSQLLKQPADPENEVARANISIPPTSSEVPLGKDTWLLPTRLPLQGNILPQVHHFPFHQRNKW